MRNRISLRHADTWIFLSSAVFLLSFFAFEVQSQLHLPSALPILPRLLLLITVCALLFLGAHLYAQRTGSTRHFFALLLLYFVLYLYLLLNVTLLEKGFGRHALIGETNEDARAYYLHYFVNLRPFRSIWEVYVQGLIAGYVAPYYVLLNLLGNVCALMPLSFFLPRLFRSQERWYVFLPTAILSVVVIELLQFLFMVGSCDVDDLILNAGGAILMYFLLRIPPLRRLTDRMLPPRPHEKKHEKPEKRTPIA